MMEAAYRRRVAAGRAVSDKIAEKVMVLDP